MSLPTRRTTSLVAVIIAVTLIVGSGAFTALTVDRSATVSVAGDGSSLLAISPHANAPGSVTFGSGNTFSLTVGQSTTTTYDPLFNVTNQGSQSVAVWIEDFDYSGSTSGGDLAGDIVGDIDDDNTANVTFYNTVWGGNASCENGVPSLEDQGNAVQLDPGQTLVVSLQANASDVSGEEADLLDEMIIHADATVTGVTTSPAATC